MVGGASASAADGGGGGAAAGGKARWLYESYARIPRTNATFGHNARTYANSEPLQAEPEPHTQSERCSPELEPEPEHEPSPSWSWSLETRHDLCLKFV